MFLAAVCYLFFLVLFPLSYIQISTTEFEYQSNINQNKKDTFV
jgi:hypothetical protein